MAETLMMRADEIASGFNSVEDRQYWRASIGGTRLRPTVNFNSRTSMIQVSYRIATNDFTVDFSKTAVAFGDYMGSMFRALSQILAALKAAGLPFAAPLADDAALMVEFDPRSKDAVIAIVRHGDTWANVVPMAFKVPQRESTETDEIPLDEPSTEELPSEH